MQTLKSKLKGRMSQDLRSIMRSKIINAMIMSMFRMIMNSHHTFKMSKMLRLLTLAN